MTRAPSAVVVVAYPLLQLLVALLLVGAVDLGVVEDLVDESRVALGLILCIVEVANFSFHLLHRLLYRLTLRLLGDSWLPPVCRSGFCYCEFLGLSRREFVLVCDLVLVLPLFLDWRLLVDLLFLFGYKSWWLVC